MIQKTIPPIPVIFFTARTTLKDISKFVGTVARQLYATAASEQLLPTGPLQWIYTGADGKPDTLFTLEIALPVDGELKNQSVFLQKELPSFECISTMHYGPWDHLFEAYDRTIDEIYSKGKKLNGFCREQYLYMDFNEPANNITEVQVGV